MAGYTRQSVANIVNGSKITAPPLNAEFNKIQDAFNLTSGHTHDGTTGNSQPIPLSTSVVGYLPVVNGGVGGKNNTTATADPTTADDATQGYAPGSIWINANTGYTHMCLYNTQNAANWITIAAISNTNIVAPKATNTVDLGTSTFQFKDIHIDGTGYIDAVLGETVSTTGDVTVGGALTVTGLSTIGDITTSNIDIDGGSIDGTPIGAGTASSGAFAGLTATGNVTFAGATIANLGTVTSADIDGGSIDAVTLGTNSAVTEAQIDNIKIDGNAITSTDTNGNISITPEGTGTVDISKANVTGGSIDGTTVGATTASTGDFTTLTASTSITGDLTGDVTGDLTGDVYASNGTKVLESGTDGTDATFTGNVTGNLSGNVSSTGSSTFDILNIDSALTFNAGATATISNLVTPTNSGDAANKGYVDTAVSNLVDSAPGALDTLNELAAALGDDASFSTTMTNSLATKLPLAGGVMTGDINMTDASNTKHRIFGIPDVPLYASEAVSKNYADSKLAKTGGTLTGTLSMNTSKITNLGTPVLGTDASTKQYVDDTLNYGIVASTSASQASNSASAAATSALSVLFTESAVTSLYDSFDDRYLGAKSSVPNTDNDGDALLVGALYFDTTSNAMKVYTGTGGWVETGSTVNGILDKFRYVSTASQTTFSGSDANGNTLAYDPSAVDVYLSGLRLVAGTDYTATSGTSIQLTTAPDTGSTLEIVAFGNVVVNDPQQITASQLDLKAIAETKAQTAVDVFVYDTSKDSDGGAWRNRTQGTSWYNEALNTSSRGTTKKFPAVAVIVLEDQKLTIYDADDPSMPMWMSFFTGQITQGSEQLYRFMISGNLNAVTMKNGLLCVARSSFIGVDFIGDRALYAHNANGGDFSGHTISKRNEYGSIANGNNWLFTGFTVQPQFNDIAVTVLPNAPIDPDTGLPVPTIAVAGDYGVSVIKDDGSIVDSLGTGTRDFVFISDNNDLYVMDSQFQWDFQYYGYIGDLTEGFPILHNHYRNSPAGMKIPDEYQYRTAGLAKNDPVVGHNNHGISIINENYTTPDEGLVANITSTYNTGWMNGDIKLATLMDTTAETIVAPELVTNGGFDSTGPELITNGTFNTDVSNWNMLANSSIVRTDGTNYPSQPVGAAYIITNTGGVGPSQTFPTIVGETYAVSVNVIYSNQTNVSSEIASIHIGNQSGYTGALKVSKVPSTGTHTFTFVAQQTTSKIYIKSINSVVSDLVVDDISVKQNVLATSGWTLDGFTVSNGKLVKVAGTGNSKEAAISCNLIAGKTYVATFDYVDTGSNLQFSIGTATSLRTQNFSITEGTGAKSITFTPNTNMSYVGFAGHDSYVGEVDNISVRLAVPDRSVNNNGLNIVGNVTKSAVATGAELVGYGGMSTSNRLVQPYNSDLDFGTGDFSIMAWVKTNSLSSQYILDRSNRTDNTNRLNFLIGSTNSNLFTRIDVTTCTVDYDFEEGLWYCVAVCRRQGVLYFYVNGKLIGTKANTQSNTGTFETTIAGYNTTGAQSPNSTALVRISATAPTAEQIAKIYRDEKPLFQEGAKCTLSGTTDQVYALDYDEDMEILHVGTLNDRDEFKGLRRVKENDVEGTLTVAISAANGLVVEE